MKTKGILAGIFASVCYGTNPLGALFCYQEGLSAMSTVFYRYLWAVVMMAILMLVTRHNFKLAMREYILCLGLGLFFVSSSLLLFLSFNYMDAGMASTILFSYPIMVAVIMSVFFKERLTLTTILSLVLAVWGVVMLSRGEGGASIIGVVLVLASSLTYAIYIVAINRLHVEISSITLTFYVSLVAVIALFAAGKMGLCGGLQMLPSVRAAMWSAQLGLVPTVLSLIFINISIKLVGSTPAAIMGALEPFTAVCIGVMVFGEQLSGKLILGMIMILSAVMLVIINSSKQSQHLKKNNEDKE
jgi:drug/metabolite transporter (DMT)-like permease